LEASQSFYQATQFDVVVGALHNFFPTRAGDHFDDFAIAILVGNNSTAIWFLYRTRVINDPNAENEDFPHVIQRNVKASCETLFHKTLYFIFIQRSRLSLKERVCFIICRDRFLEIE
jgi:uncharacterized membrane protein YcfT